MSHTPLSTKELVAHLSCTGCFACVDVCPVAALEFGTDSTGFLRPKFNEEKCIHCGICVRACPVHAPVCANRKEPDVFAFMADDETRFLSSSGGAFPIIAKNFLRNGGKVIGCAWDSQFHARLVIIDSEADLPKLCKSKYVRSFTDDIYQVVKTELNRGTKILFSGLPCQVAGLYASLGQKFRQNENLYTLDIICAQAPSDFYWQKYLQEVFGGTDKIADYEFRNKRGAWGNLTKVSLKNGHVHHFDNTNNLWNRLFYGRHLAPDACCNCRFGTLPRQADMTIGDFWQIGDYAKELVDGKGVSVVLTNSRKGDQLLENLREEKDSILQKTPLAWACDKNRVNWRPIPPSRQRNDILHLSKRMSLAEAEKRALAGRTKFDIGIVAHFRNRNYGGALTAYALYEVIAGMGYDVMLIDAVPRWLENDFSPFRSFSYPPERSYFNFTKRSELYHLNEQCERFLLGSDQLLSEGWYPRLDKIPSLAWVKNSKKKAGYAVSFGVSSFCANDEIKIELSNALGAFDSLTCREKSGVGILEKEFGISDALNVLDPVFLCERETFESLAKNGIPVIQNGGVFGYILQLGKQNLLRKIMEDIGLDARIIGDRSKTRENNSPQIDPLADDFITTEDWLASILSASLVITDSYHAVCLAIIFNKPFIVCAPQRHAAFERFSSLLELLSLTNRICNTFDDFLKLKTDAILYKINWNGVSEILKKEKQFSMKMLKKCVAEERTNEWSKDKFLEMQKKYESQILGLSTSLNQKTSELEKEANELTKMKKKFQDTTSLLSETQTQLTSSLDRIHRYHRMSKDPIITLYRKIRRALGTWHY